MEHNRMPRTGYFLVDSTFFREQALEALRAFFTPVTSLYGAITRASDPVGLDPNAIDRAKTAVTGAGLIDEAIHG